MNKSTPILFLLALITIFPFAGISQDKSTPEDDLKKVENYREQIRRLMGFLEFSLNTLGNPETTTRDKEVIINESYLKAFMNEKVQVEDDLDENREILTYKDVQAYLKDVDFFFKEATFKIDVQDIQSLKNDQGMPYFKVTANRNLRALTLDDQVINNDKTRYIEINLDENEQVLKIASIYTTRLNESQEMMAWWNKMPTSWKDFLGSPYFLADSIKLSQIDFLNDTTFLLFHEVPEITEKDSFVSIGGDSLLVITSDTIYNKVYDTIPAGKNNGIRMLKEITRRESLDISGKLYFTDLYPVDQMSDLKSLNISNTLIDDLFPARNLNRLTSLNITGTHVTDLRPIQYNSKIRELYLDSTKVRSLSPIQGYHHLEVLHLNYTLVDSLNPIRYLDSLKDLRLDNSPVSDLTPLGDLVNLEALSISGTKVDNLNSIQYLVTLKRVYFENTAIADFTPLGKLEKLEIIDADRTGVTDLSPLGNLPLLEKVYCDQTGITRSTANSFMASHPKVLIIYESQQLTSWWEGLNTDWQDILRGYASLDPRPSTEQLHQLTLVNKINIEGKTNLTSLEPLSNLTNLTEIQAKGCGISDLSPLAELKDLKILGCADTKVNSLGPLGSLTTLDQIDVSNTPLSSLEGLSHLVNLEYLNIDRTGVDDLSALMDCSDLQVVYCDETKIDQSDADQLMDHIPGCLVVYMTKQLETWWGSLSSSWKAALENQTQLDNPPTREQLHTAAKLTALNLTGNREITSLQPLTTLHRLEELNLSNGSLQDISPLASLVRLNKLNLSGNPVENLVPLGSLPALKQLDISNTAVLKLDALIPLTSLEQLNCSGTQIKKLDPLSQLVKLQKLECYNTGISSLKPLTGLVLLKQLVCYNTKLNEKKIAAFKAEAPGVEVVFY